MQIFQNLRWGGCVVLLLATNCCRLWKFLLIFWNCIDFKNIFHKRGCAVVVLEAIVLSVNKWVMSCGRPQNRETTAVIKEKRKDKSWQLNKRKEKRRKKSSTVFGWKLCLYTTFTFCIDPEIFNPQQPILKLLAKMQT